jgi:hypothetical protein
MIDDQVDSVFVALLFHVGIVRVIDNKSILGRKEAKAKTALPLALKRGGLRRSKALRATGQNPGSRRLQPA